MEEEGYWLKKVSFQGRQANILMQSKNGPCPLLALANILLLRGELSIHQDYSHITHEHLIALVADQLFEANPLNESDEYYENKKKRLEDAIAELPTLQVGMNINVRFQK